ncbi:MAG: hypothetical protein ACRCTE_11650 [Cellulosilyticaceae bacterium]
MESRANSVMIHGVVSDEKNNRLTHVRVQLLKKVKRKRRFYYIPVEQGYTDDKGAYTFKVSVCEANCYKVLAIQEMSKSLSGEEE